jgi:glycine/D-amino acid oxidase-like deaminating enzyme
MRVIEQLRQEFGHRLSIEANTVVTEVIYDPTADHAFPYKVLTPRGVLRARHVIHCSNGYAGRFLPTLRGRLFPFRGVMTVQDLGPSIPNRGAENSWNLYHPPRYDAESSIVLTGVYYLQQNPESGHFFFGGCAQTAHTVFDTNDSYVETASVQNLQHALHELFGEKPDISDGDKNELVAAWSGVMGFTGDGFPLVGRLPGSASQSPNDGNNEWIAVGFNGMGMCQSWRAGEAVAKMVMNQDVSDWLPASFAVSTERLHGSLTVEASIKSMDFYLLQNDGAELGGSVRTAERL